MTAPRNLLYYGDNLSILRRYVKDESVDLIYLDPPFNSDQEYNAFLPGNRDGSRSASQQKAFKDTWTWDAEAERSYQDITEAGGAIANTLRAMRTVLEDRNIMAYLVMMAPRLLELKRVLKPNGSLYLHCSPTAGHYLKVLLDAVFSPQNFRNEIVWRRTGSHGKGGKAGGRYGPIHDTIFFYTLGEWYTWNAPKRPHMRGHVDAYFVQEDDDRWRTNYYGNVLTGSGTRGGFSGKPWRGFDPTAKNRHWAIPSKLVEEVDEDMSKLNVLEKLEKLYQLGLVTITPGEAWPLYQHYLKPEDGTAVPDIWAYQPYTRGTLHGSKLGIDEDVRWLSTQDRERLGYPTQKPEGLLERIIRTSSKRGDTVLDPFCGCGTTVAVAERMGRNWIGIDIAQFAVSLIKWRMHTAFGPDVAKRYRVIGEPTTVEDAEGLAAEDPYKFQWWAVGRIMGVRPLEGKKGADKGIDGRMIFTDEDGPAAKEKEVIFSAKSGKLKADDVRALLGVITRDKAEIGVLISLKEPTDEMRIDAAKAGTYKSPAGSSHPKIQILTIADVLKNKGVDLPVRHSLKTFKNAPAAKREPEVLQQDFTKP